MTDTSSEIQMSNARIAVVIPSYKVTRHIAPLIAAIPSYVWKIYVVDDACPDESGNFVKANCTDFRITIICHKINQGVGGAVMTGYRAAIEDGAQIIVKIDGDGQMDPALIPNFVEPILSGEADYTKGNRFFDLEKVRAMPKIRLIGNAVLSLMTKLSSGYWDLFDPTNGYTAIHAKVAHRLPMHKLSRRYFFETDVLFRLNTLRAVVMDVPMEAQYGDEVSNLKISKIVTEFLLKHLRNFIKRVGYNYYLRDMSLGSLELPVGLVLFFGGGAFGIYQWINSARAGVETSSGTVMLAALPLLMGIQLILSFFGQDIASVPRTVLHKKLVRHIF